MDPVTIVIQLALILVSGFVSGYFGYRFAHRQQKEVRGEEDLESRKQLVEAFITELLMNKEMLEAGVHYIKNLRDREVEWFSRPLYMNTYNSAINSGKFLLLTPETQAVLTLYHERLSTLDDTRSNPGGTLVPQIYKPSIDAIKELIPALLDTLPEIIETLEKEIK